MNKSCPPQVSSLFSHTLKSTHASVFMCVCLCQGYSHIAGLSGYKATLRGYKSPHPCRKVLAQHPQTQNSHKLATNSLAFLPLSSFLLSVSPSHLFSWPAAPPPAFKIKCHPRAAGSHTHTHMSRVPHTSQKWVEMESEFYWMPA